MLDFNYYRVYLIAGLAEAERYLISDELFWPLNIAPPVGEPSYPNFTLGSFLFFQACARSLAKGGGQSAAMQKIDAEIDLVRSRWQVAWGRKASWGFESRLRQWGNVLKDIRIDPEGNLGYYNYEVRLRVFVHLLREEIKEIEPSDQEHLESLDLLLRALFDSGDFIWEPELAGGFPKEPYWYLWGKPREP